MALQANVEQPEQRVISRRDRLVDVGIGTAIALFSAWVWWTARTTIPTGMRTDPLGPTAVPQLLALGTGALGLMLAVSRLVRNRWLQPDAVGENGPFVEESGGTFSRLRFWGLIGLSALYLAALEPIGYLISTPAYGAMILLLLGVRSWPKVLFSVILMTAILYGIFQRALNVPLPGGVLEGFLG